MSPEESAPPSDSSGSVRVGGLGLAVVPLLIASPSRAFERLRADPQWVGTFLFVLILMGLAAWIQLPQTQAFARERMASEMERQGTSEAEIREITETVTSPALLLGGGLAVSALVLFLAGVVLHVVINLSGPKSPFRSSSAIYWTAGLATVAGALIKAGLARAADSVEVSLSPAALFPDLEFGSVPMLFLEIFDLFSLLNLWLLVTGIRIVLSTSDRSAWAIGGGYWLVFSLARFGIAAVTSRAGGAA